MRGAAPSPLGRGIEDPDAAPPRLLAPPGAMLNSVGPEGTSQRLGDALDRFRQVVQDPMLPVLRVQAKVERIIGRPLSHEDRLRQTRAAELQCCTTDEAGIPFLPFAQCLLSTHCRHSSNVSFAPFAVIAAAIHHIHKRTFVQLVSQCLLSTH
jgi:hypothetical protein